MSAVDWMPLLSTGAGALIALSGSFLVDLRRERDTRARDRDLDRWRTCVDFALALDAAHTALRSVPAGDRQAASVAMTEAGAYQARERLLMSGTPDLVVAGEVVFHRLVAMRKLIGAGSDVRSPAGHESYHEFAEALWTFRMAVRQRFGHRALQPGTLKRRDWSERHECAYCATPG
ncbi:hypothetical protein [Micromonospora sp. KC723]|uniref:hypothetical protein n=1 Tax=Micromonospora sp. KC723 TaxID=2530381 RepID=UPI00104AE083|nr:hypothetical protein [Micromonospora sp. KC723]TDB71563.1 hypothetical protein E1165_22670 [Micromonospora sp. KC723]